MRCENILEYIDNLAHDRSKKIVIWGAGKTTEIICEITEILESESLVIVDENKSGQVFYSHILKKSNEINFNCIDIVIISSINAQDEICNILEKYYFFQGEIINLYKNDRKLFISEQKVFFEYLHRIYQKRVTKLKEKKQIRIGYIATQNELWNLQSFYEEIMNDSKFVFEVVAMPNPENILDSPKESCCTNYNFFKDNNINVVYGYDFADDKIVEIEKWDYDILFWDQPGTWSSICNDVNYYRILKRFLLCYVPYGYKVADGKENHFGQYVHNTSWKIFVESEWHYNQFKKYGQVNGKNVVITGFPKLDRYLSGCNNYSNWKSGFSSKKRVIWAPHWTFNHPGWEYSTFDQYYMRILEYAINHKEIDWIVKPHQRLYFWCVESGLMTEREMNDYFEKWNNLDNAVVCNGGNYMDIFMTSDALITDCGSFLAEYLPSEKPVIHLYNSNAKYNEIGQNIVQTYYRCTCWEEIVNTIERVIINEDDYLKDERLEMKKYVVPNPQGAGKAIFEELKNIFL